MTAARAAPLVIRPAHAGDSRTLFDWVNRPDSRAASLRTVAPIDWDTHAAWFADRLSNPDVVHLIAESGGAPVGQARAERQGDHAAVAIYVEPARRRGGIARRLLEALRAEAVARWPGVRLVARIRRDNPISARLFDRAGYRRIADEADHTVHER